MNIVSLLYRNNCEHHQKAILANDWLLNNMIMSMTVSKHMRLKKERFLIWTRQNNVHIFGIHINIIIYCLYKRNRRTDTL